MVCVSATGEYGVVRHCLDSTFDHDDSSFCTDSDVTNDGVHVNGRYCYCTADFCNIESSLEFYGKLWTKPNSAAIFFSKLNLRFLAAGASLVIAGICALVGACIHRREQTIAKRPGDSGAQPLTSAAARIVL